MFLQRLRRGNTSRVDDPPSGQTLFDRRKRIVDETMEFRWEITATGAKVHEPLDRLGGFIRGLSVNEERQRTTNMVMIEESRIPFARLMLNTIRREIVMGNVQRCSA